MASSCSAHSSDPSEVGRINEFFQGFQPTDAPLSGEVYDGVLRHSTDGCTSALLEVPEGSQSHASNLAALPDGTLGLVWFNGDEEGVHNVILFAQLSVGSDRWSHPVQVSGEPSRSAQNPVLFYDEPSACLMVLHTSQVRPRGFVGGRAAQAWCRVSLHGARAMTRLCSWTGGARGTGDGGGAAGDVQRRWAVLGFTRRHLQAERRLHQEPAFTLASRRVVAPDVLHA
jgi:hypothetical protein